MPIRLIDGLRAGTLAGTCALAAVASANAAGCGLSDQALHRIAGGAALAHYNRETAPLTGEPALTTADWPAPNFVERHDGRCRVLYGGGKAGPAATVDVDAQGTIVGIRSYHAAK